MALSECPAAAASTIWLRRATCRGVPKADNHCCSCCCSVSWIGKAGVARGMRSTVAQAAYVVKLFVGHIARLFLGHYTSMNCPDLLLPRCQEENEQRRIGIAGSISR